MPAATISYMATVLCCIGSGGWCCSVGGESEQHNVVHCAVVDTNNHETHETHEHETRAIVTNRVSAAPAPICILCPLRSPPTPSKKHIALASNATLLRKKHSTGHSPRPRRRARQKHALRRDRGDVLAQHLPKRCLRLRTGSSQQGPAMLQRRRGASSAPPCAATAGTSTGSIDEHLASRTSPSGSRTTATYDRCRSP